MNRYFNLSLIALAFSIGIGASADAKKPAAPVKPGFGAQDGFAEHEFFDAMEKGLIDVQFVAKSDRAARLIIANKLKEGVNLRMPEAFAGVPENVLAQLGGGLGGGGLGGGTGIGGGGAQGVGGGIGGGGGGFGGGGLGGGGGAFSIPPEKVGKINLPVVCLDHGKPDPSSSKPYRIIPIDQYVKEPAVIELMKAFGRGELQHDAAQAATWHLNNKVSWEELASKKQGSERSFVRPPYFAPQSLQIAVNYANEAQRLAVAAAKEQAEQDSLAPKDDKSLSEESEVSTTPNEDTSASK